MRALAAAAPCRHGSTRAQHAALRGHWRHWPSKLAVCRSLPRWIQDMSAAVVSAERRNAMASASASLLVWASVRQRRVRTTWPANGPHERSAAAGDSRLASRRGWRHKAGKHI